MVDGLPNFRRSIVGSEGFSRRLKVYFYTSNLEKLLQARLLFQMSGQVLSHFRASREPYEEDYSLPKQELLEKAIGQVRNQFLVRSVFFVEDTSIRIEALSDDNSDFPGLRAKEWFGETSFNDLDFLLRKEGNDRRVTVKSDIALHIPNLEEVFLFHGETSGLVAEFPPSFEVNSVHPWLTPATFNGWFVPDGSVKPLGAMGFDESQEFDFRGKALNKLLTFLRPLNAAANLPSSFFVRDQRKAGSDIVEPYLPHVFDPVDDTMPIVICIVGHKCSGKTTASEFILNNFGASFFEASDQLRNLTKDFGIEVRSSDTAREFLEEHGQDIVARQIVDQLVDEQSPVVVISGLRTVEELETIHRSFSGVKTFLISADRRIRFERHVRRGRDREVKTPEEFQTLDGEQLAFGLLTVADEIADVSIVNESDLASFFTRINAATRSALFENSGRTTANYSELTELHRSLVALNRLGRLSTCDEISSETEVLGSKVWKYNTNRALKNVPMFVDRVDQGEELLSYRINERGVRLLNLLNIRRRYHGP